MCRRNCALGCCMMCLGVGILMGFCLGSWFWCACCSLSLIGLGFVILRQK